VKQARAEAIPILKQVLEVRTVSSSEREEIRDTISALQDPAAYQKEIDDTVNKLADNAQNLYS
jgi:hypothetical protein